MKKEVGLWIDRRRAAIVTLMNEEVEMKQIIADVDKHERFSGKSLGVNEEDIRDRRFDNNLKRYYDKIITNIQDANSILIFGPGEAKIELKKRIEGKSFLGKNVHIEAEDKMTDRQITAKVRQYFLNQNKE
jgi:hypothetical protein